MLFRSGARNNGEGCILGLGRVVSRGNTAGQVIGTSGGADVSLAVSGCKFKRCRIRVGALVNQRVDGTCRNGRVCRYGSLHPIDGDKQRSLSREFRNGVSGNGIAVRIRY